MNVGELSVVPFQLCGSWFALNAHHVREVVGALQQLVVPNATPQVPALCAWRSRAIPVLDLEHVLRVAPQDNAQRSRVLLIECAGNTLAVPVAAVRAVERISSEQCRPAHVVADTYCPTEIHHQGAVMGLVDIERLVSDQLGSSEHRSEASFAAAQ